MENPETIMAEVIGICSSCANLFMCAAADEDDEGDVIMRMICLVINEEVDVRIAKCSHYIDREETPIFFNNPYK